MREGWPSDDSKGSVKARSKMFLVDDECLIGQVKCQGAANLPRGKQLDLDAIKLARHGDTI